MYPLKAVTFVAALVLCSHAYAGDTTPATTTGNTSGATTPPCRGDADIAKFELKVIQDGKTEADLMASPSVCGLGSRVGIHLIPPTPVDGRQVDASNTLDVEWSIEPAGRQGEFMVSLETKHLDAAHSTQATPGMVVSNLARRAWSGVVALKPGEEMTILKDGGQVVTMRRTQ